MMNKNNLTIDWWKESAYIKRFAGSGVINTFIGFFVIFSAMIVGFSPVASNIAGYVVGFVTGFVLSKKFVFRSNGHFVGESIRYLAAFVVSFLFNLIVLNLALMYSHLHAAASQIAAAVSYTALMYILTRYFVFRPEKSGSKALDESH